MSSEMLDTFLKWVIDMSSVKKGFKSTKLIIIFDKIKILF